MGTLGVAPVAKLPRLPNPRERASGLSRNGSKRLLQEQNERFHRAAKSRRFVERQWTDNLAALVAAVDSQGLARLEDNRHAQEADWMDAIRLNYLPNILSVKVAKMMKDRPIVEAIPANNTIEARDAAVAAESLVDNAWHRQGMLDELDLCLSWSSVCGPGILKTYWDKDVGDTFWDAETGQPFMQGDVRSKAISPFNIYPDPMLDRPRMNELAWAFEVVRITAADFARIFERRPQKRDSTPDPGTGDAGTEHRLRQVLHVERDPDTSDEIAVRVYIERPTPEFPHGRRIVSTVSMLLEVGPMPGPWPYEMMADQFVPGRFWPRSWFDDLVPVQNEINEVVQQIAENRRLMANPSWWVPRSAGIDDIYSTPGGINTYDSLPGIPPPQAMQPPQMPGYVQDEAGRGVEDLARISGVSELTLQGRPPPGMRSARAIAALGEFDETRLAPLATRFSNMVSRGGQTMLSLMQKHYTTERQVRIIGPNKRIIVRHLSGADIQDGTTLKVIIGHNIGFTKSARIENAMAMQQQGLVTPDQVKKMIDFAFPGDLFMREDMHKAEVHRKIDMVYLAAPRKEWEAKDWDDPAISAEELALEMLSDRYAKAPPEAQNAIEGLWREYGQRIQQAQQAAFEQQLLLEGKGAQPQRGEPEPARQPFNQRRELQERAKQVAAMREAGMTPREDTTRNSDVKAQKAGRAMARRMRGRR